MAKKTGVQEANLFDADALYEATPLGSQGKHQPVTCLGKTFDTDDERREYFRTVLREKLPELKKLDGYPIGEDDDIINLSDPPYYTACPNPWLNDFVAEWEAEKPQFEKEGLRKADFNVTDPYASDVSEGKNNPIYNAHSYHTKVPHPAIMRYILHYTQPGDIILDGFAGTGMTGVAAQMCGHPDIDLKNKIEDEFTANGYEKPVWGARHAICGDLSPIASFIAYNYNTPVDVKKFEHDANKILDDVEKECGWMYETNHVKEDGTIEKGRINYTVWSDVFICPDCGSEIVFWDAAFDKENNSILDEFKCPKCGSKHTKRECKLATTTLYDGKIDKSIKQEKSIPVLINYTTADGKKAEKTPDENDIKIIEKIKSYSEDIWYPTNPILKGDKTDELINHYIADVHYLFTKRNLIINSKLVSKINKSRLLIILTSIITGLTSKLVRYNLGKRGNGIFAGTYYLPSLIAETNIFNVFRGKTFDLMKAFVADNNGIEYTNSASNVYTNDNTIDYIFIDPPFGSNIMYSELNYITESWLKILTNNKEEAIENNTQHKKIFDYQRIMTKCFSEYYRVLKTEHWMTVEFSNTNAAVWNTIKNGIQKAGFIIANIASLDKKQGSFNAQTSPTAVKQDLVISCYKPSKEFELHFVQQDGITNTWSFVDEQLAHLPLPEIKEAKSTAVVERSPKILYDRLITFFLMRNLPVPLDAPDFQEGLKKRYSEEDGMVFTAAQLAQYFENKKKHNIAEGQTLFNFEMIITESDAIQWCKYKLEKTPLKYNDLQPDFRKANAMTRKGEDPIELKTVLEENFIKNDDDTWRVPDLNEAKDREALRTKALLKEFARYVEDLESGKVRSLKTVRQQAVLAGFKDCYAKKDYELIVKVAEHIPQDLLNEDEMLLNYYDIATDKVGI
jgi:DNA modification methylase